MYNNSKRKVIALGLDGATFALLEPLMNEGRMPHLKNIINNGASGVLMSTIPPLTAPAWCSFATGKNPGKHGAHDFVVRDKNNEMVIINSKRIAGKKIWDILGDYNKKVGVIHFPISYPPQKLNGFMISGFITPPGTTECTYPPELYSEILEKTGEYIFNVKVPVETKWHKLNIQDIKPFIDKLHKEIKLRYKAFRYLKNAKEWDFLYMLFMNFDKVQHVLWKYLDSREVGYPRNEIYEYALRCYEQIDSILGDIIDEMDDDTSLIILSDHGFGPNRKLFYINIWLEKNGFLKKKFGRLLSAKIKEKIGIKSGKYFEGIPAPTVRRHDFLDMHRTMAYSPNSSSYGIFINLNGREKFGIVKAGEEYNRLRHELKDRLLSLRDTENGEKIFDGVYFADEIYHGSFVKNAPDLLLQPANGYLLIDSLVNLTGSTMVKVSAAEGIHRPEGIFIAFNKKDIKSCLKVDSIDIIDVAPTILYLMGLPVPSDMDGKVIVPIFDDAFLRSNPVKFLNAKQDDTSISSETIYSSEDEQKIMNELKGLGYID